MRVDPDGPYGLQKEYQKISQTHRQSLNKLSGKIRRGDVVIYTGTLSPDLHGEIGIVTAVESDECVDVLISSNILYPLGLIGKNLEVIDHDEDLLKEPEYHSQQMRDEMDEQGTVMSFNDVRPPSVDPVFDYFHPPRVRPPSIDHDEDLLDEPKAEPRIGDVVIIKNWVNHGEIWGNIGVITSHKPGEFYNIHYMDDPDPERDFPLCSFEFEIIDHDEDLLVEEEHPWDKDLREHYHQHGQGSCARPREIHPEAPMNMMGVYEIQGRRVQVDLHPGVAGETPSIKFTCCCCGSKLLDLPIEFPYPPIANRKWISDTHEMGK
jgi:hypothetical protein